MQQLLIILILVLLILSLISQLEELKKNPSEFIKKKIIEFFLISIKDKQKIGSSYNDKDDLIPKGTFKIGNINSEKCYSTDTRSGNSTKRINTNYCDQGIDGSEVIPYTDLSTIDFNNYNIHYGKKAKGIPLTGTFNNNGIVITLDTNGQVSNRILSVNESKLFCDSMGDKCYGFITIIPTKTSNSNNGTFFLKNTLEGWEDPDTYIKINVIGRNMNNHKTNTNYISYIKKNVNYVEKTIDDTKLKSISDKYINLATCNWKSGNRCIFKDYVYDQTKDTCTSADGLTYNVPEINSYSQQVLNDWLTALYKRDLGANKLTSEAVNVNEYIQRCKEVNEFEFLAGISLPNPYIPTTKPGDVKGRYVRITTNNVTLNDSWLNFAELQVISNNKNIAVGKPSSASSSTTNPSKGNDGNSNSDVINDNLNNSSVFLSGNDGGPQYWEVDLGDASQTIDRVIVAKGSNTANWGQQILNNWLLSIYDYNKKIIWARIYKEAPDPKIIIDILNANNDMNNIRVKDYNESRFNKYFQRVSDTEYSTKRGRSGDCSEQCHKEICEGEKKKWIGSSNYGCRDYRPDELEAELAEKAKINNFKHTFTNAGATGPNGPTLSQIRSAYSNASWAQDSNNLNMMAHEGIQEWKVPVTGTYTIRAMGAGGGNSNGGGIGGSGIDISITTKLTKGEVIKILVGQRGLDAISPYVYGSGGSPGGGGGTFVVRGSQTPIIIAGGGGGGTGNTGSVHQGGHGLADYDGYGRGGGGFGSFTPGVNGYGATMTSGSGSGYGGQGGGLLSDGQNWHYEPAGKGFINGGKGGLPFGGFGGGACGYNNGNEYGGGGGGGYSGGSGASYSVASGGGGSYAISTMNVIGYNREHGSVTITLVSEENANAGIIIYSEPEYRGKSLFLKPGSYDKKFFDNNWGVGIGSYKSNNDSPNYMIGFDFRKGGIEGGPQEAGGGTTVGNLNNWSKVFGGSYTTHVFNGVVQFIIHTPSEYKEYWCKATGAKRYNSHWASFPSSDCY